MTHDESTAIRSHRVLEHLKPAVSTDMRFPRSWKQGLAFPITFLLQVCLPPSPGKHQAFREDAMLQFPLKVENSYFHYPFTFSYTSY